MITFFSMPLLFMQQAGAQVYKCKQGTETIIQDRPCAGSIRRAQDLPRAKSESTASTDASANDIQDRLNKDKAYLAERGFIREKNEAKTQIENCDADVSQLQYQINQVAEQPGTFMGQSARAIAAMQLEEQRRQTIIAGLQAKISTRQSQCQTMRRDFELKYQK